MVADNGPSYLDPLGRDGWIGEWFNGDIMFRGGFRLGRRDLLWSHSGRYVQRVVHIDSSGFSDDFSNKIGLGCLGRRGD